jgi:hypothetical protein
LLIGGATNESLDILISSTFLPTPDLTPNDSPVDEPTPDRSGVSEWAPAPTAHPFVPQAPPSTTSNRRQQNLPPLKTTLHGYNLSPPETACADGGLLAQTIEDSQEYGDTCSESSAVKRSLVITGLSSTATLQGLVKVLKGGPILQMYLSKRKCSAHVSFVDPIAAESFLGYAQTNEIYIQGKRVCDCPSS